MGPNELRQKELDAAQAISEAAKADDSRSLTEDEQKTYDAHMTRAKDLRVQIERDAVLAAELADATTSTRRIAPEQPTGTVPAVPKDDKVERMGGFRDRGEFLTSVVRSSGRGAVIDPRLIEERTDTSTFANEGTGADGGFAVPDDIRTEIASFVFADSGVLGLTDQVPISGNSLTFPRSETTPWGTTGVTCEWLGEGGNISESKPLLGNDTISANKIAALVPITDELLEDSAAMSGFVSRKAGEAISYKIDDAIINGNGVAKPLGIVNSGAIVSQAKEGSQTADTIVAGNVAKMFGRMPANMINSAVWLISQDALQQLVQMTLGDQPIYVAGGTFNQFPYGLLFGRPVMPIPQCDTIGDQNDIFFVNMSQYITVVKSSGLKSDISMHLWFDQDITAFRFTFRIGGQPWQAAAITPPNSAVTQSPFIRLDERA